jgi:hypothetical protein
MKTPSRDAVLKTLRAHELALRELGADSVSLFGSVAREDAKAESDVDILLDYRPALRGLGVIHLFQAIEALFDRPVDVVARTSLHPALRGSIEADAIRAF